MSGSSQSRRKSKHKLEPISYEEMLGTAGMSGFVSFLDVTPADANRTPEGSGYTAGETERTQSEPPSHAKRELATASETSSPPRIAISQPAPLRTMKEVHLIQAYKIRFHPHTRIKMNVPSPI